MALKASLHIETACRKGRTILKNCFFTPPFKIADITEDKTEGKLELMLMSSSPGTLDGDEYTIRIDVEEQCGLELKTQAYQRIFQMKTGAKQFTDIHLKKGASFIYIPHPLVPHGNSIFLSKTKIVMDSTSSLVWGEVISCGRKLNGEVFSFSSYHSSTEIFIGKKLVVKENILIRPFEVNVNAIGQMEGYTHQASLICIDEQMDVTESIERVIEFLQEEKNIAFGISALPANGIIIRLLGDKAEPLFVFLRKIAAACIQKRLKQNSNVA
jgi:urease accessory protein